jgi:hypothetical protein
LLLAHDMRAKALEKQPPKGGVSGARALSAPGGSPGPCVTRERTQFLLGALYEADGLV